MQTHAAVGLRKFVAFVLGALLMAALLCVFASCGAPGPRAKSGAASRARAQRTSLDFLKRVHFATGSDLLDEEAQGTLHENVSWLIRHPDAVLVLEGHCDERGDQAYNMQLGDRRARRVKAHLIAADIHPERLIMVVSHGEMRPLDPRHTADAWRQNRRVEFIIR